MQILWSFIHLYVSTNLYYFLSTMKQDIRLNSSFIYKDSHFFLKSQKQPKSITQAHSKNMAAKLYYVMLYYINSIEWC